MNKNILIMVIVFQIAQLLYAEEKPKLEWVARYTGSTENHGYPLAVAVDDKENVYVTGASYSNQSMTNGGKDYATVKYDKNGKQLWVARYNGFGGSDEAYAIAIDHSGNVYVTGNSKGNRDVQPYFKSLDYATVKYDPNGKELWVKRWEGTGGATNIFLDSKENIYVVGYGGIIKYKDDGSKIWQAQINIKNFKMHCALDKLDNIYVEDGKNIYKYDSKGSETWKVDLKEQSYESLAVSKMCKVALIGYGYPRGINSYFLNEFSNYDFLTIMFDKNGKKLWMARYDGSWKVRDDVKSLCIDDSENLYVSGDSTGKNRKKDSTIIKYSSNGNQLWERRYRVDDRDTIISDMKLDISGNSYIVGWSICRENLDETGFFILKYSSSGELLWNIHYNGNFGSVRKMMIDKFDNIYVIGEGGYNGGEYVTIKYSQQKNNKVSK
jgi:hypothetical protein